MSINHDDDRMEPNPNREGYCDSCKSAGCPCPVRLRTVQVDQSPIPCPQCGFVKEHASYCSDASSAERVKRERPRDFFWMGDPKRAPEAPAIEHARFTGQSVKGFTFKKTHPPDATVFYMLDGERVFVEPEDFVPAGAMVYVLLGYDGAKLLDDAPKSPPTKPDPDEVCKCGRKFGEHLFSVRNGYAECKAERVEWVKLP